MSRIARAPIDLPSGVEVKISGQEVNVKGAKGQLAFTLADGVEVKVEDNVLSVTEESVVRNPAMAGTMRSVLGNMVHGVATGWERKLTLVGVGYRAQAKGNTLGLSLGFSHPVDHKVPEGITIETPSQTEIVIRGADKQVVGQVAAEIRAYRPPEPYKGKGVRYSDEHVLRKEAKKK